MTQLNRDTMGIGSSGEPTEANEPDERVTELPKPDVKETTTESQ